MKPLKSILAIATIMTIVALSSCTKENVNPNNQTKTADTVWRIKSASFVDWQNVSYTIDAIVYDDLGRILKTNGMNGSGTNGDQIAVQEQNTFSWSSNLLTCDCQYSDMAVLFNADTTISYIAGYDDYDKVSFSYGNDKLVKTVIEQYADHSSTLNYVYNNDKIDSIVNIAANRLHYKSVDLSINENPLLSIRPELWLVFGGWGVDGGDQLIYFLNSKYQINQFIDGQSAQGLVKLTYKFDSHGNLSAFTYDNELFGIHKSLNLVWGLDIE